MLAVATQPDFDDKRRALNSTKFGDKRRAWNSTKFGDTMILRARPADMKKRSQSDDSRREN